MKKKCSNAYTAGLSHSLAVRVVSPSYMACCVTVPTACIPNMHTRTATELQSLQGLGLLLDGAVLWTGGGAIGGTCFLCCGRMAGDR